MQFAITKSGFVVTFYRRPEDGFAPREALVGTDTTQIGSQKSTQKGSQKTSQRIIAAMTANPDVIIAELAEMFGISTHAVKKHLSRLKKQNRIRRVGPDKGGHWEVVAR